LVWRRVAFALGLSTFLLGAAAPAEAQAPRKKAKYELKIATIAPEGSTWMNVMGELDAQVREKTNGEVGLRFYPGGIQGEDLVVLRKIRAGQLHGGGFTGVGLGEIAPALRVMELPFLFQDAAEVRAVHEKLDPLFETTLHDAGYTLVGWAEVGFVYLYSKTPVASTADLKAQKVWLWEGDPLAEAFLRAAGVVPVPLSITDVLTSLQTGLITTVYITPYGCIGLQWFSRVAFTTDIPLTFSTGAVVVTNEAWDRIPAAYQPVVRELCDSYFDTLTEATAADDRKSMEVIAKSGVKAVTPPPQEIESFHRIGESVRAQLVGKLYDQSTLDQVLAVLQEHRVARGAPAGGGASSGGRPPIGGGAPGGSGK
jgi:TRAP-type C4-dicarboxylate transport system substrate-binding protein